VYIVLKLGQDKVHVNPLFSNGFVIKLSLCAFFLFWNRTK